MAEQFCKKFTTIHVSSTGTKTGAYAAHHNKETGWGFTADFPVTGGRGPDNDYEVKLHFWIEYVGEKDGVDAAAEQIKKIVGG